MKDYSDIYDIFEEFGDKICVTDFNIIYNGTRVDYIMAYGDAVLVWAGDPDKDNYAEEILEGKKEILEQVIEKF